MGETWQRPVPGEPFGFQVHKAGEPGRQWAAEDDWAIALPHQCNEWIVAVNSDKTAALAEARQFRAELDAAISQLESQPVTSASDAGLPPS